MHAIRNVYKMIYRSGKTLEEVLPEIEQIAQTESAISFFCGVLQGFYRYGNHFYKHYG